MNIFAKTELFVGISAIAMTTPALAQQAAAPSGTEGEIIVTAQKRAENVQDVPEAVIVVASQALRGADISSV